MEDRIHELDGLELLDGRRVTVLEVYPDGSCMCEDNALTDGYREEDYDDYDDAGIPKNYLITVRPDQIKQVLECIC